jgi:hypothetical protein
MQFVFVVYFNTLAIIQTFAADDCMIRSSALRSMCLG